jgi:hypothetical protein
MLAWATDPKVGHGLKNLQVKGREESEGEKGGMKNGARYWR